MASDFITAIRNGNVPQISQFLQNGAEINGRTRVVSFNACHLGW